MIQRGGGADYVRRIEEECCFKELLREIDEAEAREKASTAALTEPASAPGVVSGDTSRDPGTDRELARDDPSPSSVSSSVAPAAHPPSGRVDSSADGRDGASLEQSGVCDASHAAPAPSTSDPVTPAVLAVAPPAASVGLDCFPVADMADVPECDDPASELAALFRELSAHKDYPAVRTRCCQLAIHMNVLGAVAPAFRDWPRGVAPWGSAINTLITRDQIVIDYHWCHAKQMPLSPTDDVHKHLLDLDSDFDFKMAWELSGKHRKAMYRATEALCLTPLQQCQTIQLRGRDLHERMEHMCGGYRKSKGKSHSSLAMATAAIGQWINGKPRFKSHRISYLSLWQARELLGPDASKQSIAELHALMLGAQPLDRKTIAGKLNTLSKVVDGVLKPASTP